jgi:hypothetical protein
MERCEHLRSRCDTHRKCEIESKNDLKSVREVQIEFRMRFLFANPSAYRTGSEDLSQAVEEHRFYIHLKDADGVVQIQVGDHLRAHLPKMTNLLIIQ